MLIDDVLIKVQAGDGGERAAAFYKKKKKNRAAGGGGGKGGSVYIQGVSNLNALSQFRYKKDIKANNGTDGRGQLNDGSDGDDLILEVPVGTVVHNTQSKETQEILKIEEKV